MLWKCTKKFQMSTFQNWKFDVYLRIKFEKTRHLSKSHMKNPDADRFHMYLPLGFCLISVGSSSQHSPQKWRPNHWTPFRLAASAHTHAMLEMKWNGLRLARWNINRGRINFKLASKAWLDLGTTSHNKGLSGILISNLFRWSWRF